MERYYIFRNREKQGPFSLDQLRDQELNHDSLLWQEGLESWTPASDFPELKGFIIPKLPELNRKNYWKPVGITIAIIIAIALVVITTSLLHSIKIENDRNTQEEYRFEQEQQKKIQIEYEKAQARKRIHELIHLSKSDYTKKFWGGISGLKISIKNASEYTMDIVTVEVFYMKQNGGVFKTESLAFTNIKPHTEVLQHAPESSRGSSVDCRISLIKSQEIDL